MTARKDRIPKNSRLSVEKNRHFEALAIREISRMPTRAWQNMSALWSMLPLMETASRRRVLCLFLKLAHKRGNALSVKFVKRFAWHFIRELGVSTGSKAEVHAVDKMRKAAEHLANHPKASLSEIAKAAGIPKKKTTVQAWKKRKDFQAFYNDELFRISCTVK